MSEYDARLVIGVRYELEIRVIANVPEYIFANDVGMDLISVIAENDFPGVSVVSSLTMNILSCSRIKAMFCCTRSSFSLPRLKVCTISDQLFWTGPVTAWQTRANL